MNSELVSSVWVNCGGLFVTEAAKAAEKAAEEEEKKKAEKPPAEKEAEKEAEKPKGDPPVIEGKLEDLVSGPQSHCCEKLYFEINVWCCFKYRPYITTGSVIWLDFSSFGNYCSCVILYSLWLVGIIFYSIQSRCLLHLNKHVLCFYCIFQIFIML